MRFEQWANKGVFWGKVNIQSESKEILQWLSLRQHCIDVAEVFLQLVRCEHVRSKLAVLAGHPFTDPQLQRLAVFAFFHDLGKLSLGFQSKLFAHCGTWRIYGHTEEALRSLLSGSANGAITFSNFPAADLESWLTGGDDPLSALLHATWSHHGAPVVVPTGSEADYRSRAHDDLWTPYLKMSPAAELSSMVATARMQFPDAWQGNAEPIHCTPKLAHYLAGLVMLADWLASNRDVFPLTDDSLKDQERMELARGRAGTLLNGTVLSGRWPAAAFQQTGMLSFKQVFGQTPRPLQEAIEALDVTTPGAKTLAAESDTGSGKTEAALLWWAKLRAAGLVQGMYFALPTRVSARELYARVCRFVKTAYPEVADRPQVLLAVPGYVQLSERSALPSEDTLHADDERIAAIGKVWAGENAKRFLAAPIVVGTIDQALLAMLQTKHAHLRNTLLDRHLLVVDEVHASDTYMQSVLVDLLEHRRARGCWNLLLSATLGAGARSKLLGDKNVDTFAGATSAPYPSVRGELGLLVPVRKDGRKKSVRVTPLPLLNELSLCADRVVKALAAGARVLVVMNTVARAVEMQRLLESRLGSEHPALFRVNGVVCPHHGRFAAQDRLLMDHAVQKFLGEGSSGGAKVLVGTQTLEQSLDIDADVLFTDLCPMDVLLQRLGRLWRHDRSGRPSSYSADGVAPCFLLVPEYELEHALAERSRSGPGPALKALSKAGIGSVYPDLRMLALTWESFRKDAFARIPEHNRALVEYATHPEQLARFTTDTWRKHASELQGHAISARSTARHASARKVYAAQFGNEECVFSAADAATRLGEGSWLVPLERAVTTPFGQRVESFQVSARVLRLDTNAPGFAESVKLPAAVRSCDASKCSIEWAGRALGYDRFGFSAVSR